MTTVNCENVVVVSFPVIPGAYTGGFSRVNDIYADASSAPVTVSIVAANDPLAKETVIYKVSTDTSGNAATVSPVSGTLVGHSGVLYSSGEYLHIRPNVAENAWYTVSASANRREILGNTSTELPDSGGEILFTKTDDTVETADIVPSSAALADGVTILGLPSYSLSGYYETVRLTYIPSIKTWVRG